MDARTFDKSMIGSRHVGWGPTRYVGVAWTIEKVLAIVKCDMNQKVVYPVSNPISAMGGVVSLTGSLAPEGAIVKVAGMTKLPFKSQSRCLDRGEDACAAGNPDPSGALRKDADQVGLAVIGTHTGGKADVV